MWYVLISVLTIFFVKTAIDDVRMPPKYVSENYIGIFPPTKPNTIPRRSNPVTFLDERKSSQYVSILNLPKNDRIKMLVSKTVMLSYKKPDFDRPSAKGLATEAFDTKENPQNKILETWPASGTTIRQSAIEAMSMKFKIIAICESGLKHYNQDGTIVEGEKHPADKGVLQINFSVHKKEIREFETQFGISVKTPEGNIKFGEWLYQRYKMKPWEQSRYCWEPILEHLARLKR